MNLNTSPTEQSFTRGQMQAYRIELVKLIEGLIPHDGRLEPLDGVGLYRASSALELNYGVSTPAFCVIAQGSKKVVLGDEDYRYDPMQYLIATAELPIVSQIMEASKDSPYLALSVRLDSGTVNSVLASIGQIGVRGQTNVRALGVNALDGNLLDAVVRLIRALYTPRDAPYLADLIKREIIYRLCRGEQKDRLCHIACRSGDAHQIAQAIEILRSKYNQPLQVADIAQDIGMSVSGFYSHFREVTAMSPLQFQKRLRLQTARRLMLIENLDASSTGYKVGYNDASHFNRDYKGLFGLPPRQDILKLRQSRTEEDDETTAHG